MYKTNEGLTNLLLAGDLEEVAIDSPFWSKSKALSYLHKRDTVTLSGKTYRQGIVCECCVNRCGLSELMEYCAADPATDRPTYAVSKKWLGLLSSPAVTTNTEHAMTSDMTESDTSATTGSTDDRVTTPSGRPTDRQTRLQTFGRQQLGRGRLDTSQRVPQSDLSGITAESSHNDDITAGLTAIHHANQVDFLERIIRAEELNINEMEQRLRKRQSA